MSRCEGWLLYIQFNSIYFPSKQQTHLKNTQDGGDATKSKILKNVAPPLQLKTTTTTTKSMKTKLHLVICFDHMKSSQFTTPKVQLGYS